MRNLVTVFDQRLLVKVISHAYGPADDKVHLKYFVFFVIYNIFFFAFREMARFKAISYVIKEFAIFILLRIEEKPEVVENVIKQVVYDYPSLDASG